MSESARRIGEFDRDGEIDRRHDIVYFAYDRVITLVAADSNHTRNHATNRKFG